VKKLFVIALLIGAGCNSAQEATEKAKRTAERWSKNMSDRTGEIECVADNDSYTYRNCSIFRKEVAPLSVRCDSRTCIPRVK